MNRVTPLILAVALFMEQMDSTVIATSLPAIAADLDTSPIALKLALTTYLVALAIFIPASGWVADRFGAKRVFIIAIFVFMAGSLFCAVAGSLGEFVGARFLQGMGGSMMTPVARLVLVRATERSRLVEALAWLTVPALVGPMVGPPIGGFLTTYVSWYWIFLVNIPIGLIGVAFSLAYLPVIQGHENGRFDTTGFILSGLAASGVVFGLSVVSLPALPLRYGVISVAAGIGCIVLYWLHTKRKAQPLLDPKLFRITTFRASIVSATIARLGIGATPFLLPLMLQIGFGLSAFESGMVTFVGAIGALVVKFATMRIYARFGFKRVLVAMIGLSALFLMAMTLFSPALPFAVIYSILLLNGFVRSLMFTGFNALVFADVEQAEAGPATAISAVFQQISMALGVAVAGVLVEASLWWRGDALGLADFHFAFFCVGIVTALAILPILRLHTFAGSEVSGHGKAHDGVMEP
ncbi:MAG: MFS transporter [Rhizobiaceae bacterium MnEN-MB40S]|nr:MAG: MFS transporter [Rhizobiaceae bacterium MnEN-MB40S]